MARSYGLYASPLRDFILLLKFRHRERWGPKLGALLAPLMQEVSSGVGEPPALLIPVPLHPSRQRERGFNQAEALAYGLVRALRKRQKGHLLRLETGCLRRQRSTAPQSSLHHHARAGNVQGAFAVRHAERLRGRSVVLVDDVMTTGATASACARVLKRAGAGKVVVLTLARVTPQFPDSQLAPLAG